MFCKNFSIVAIVALSSACSAAEQPNQQNAQHKVPDASTRPVKPETIKTDSGLTYVVERVAGFKATDIPQNTDLKMADGDLAKYAVQGCALYARAEYAPSRCDVYVQADKSGTLIGYAFVYKEPKGVFFSTATTLNTQKEPGAESCTLSGAIYDEKSQYQSKMVADPSRDFEGRQMYYTFKNGAGATLVSEADPSSDASLPEDAAMGVWYIKKQGDKLRIEQERWNYCYKKADVYIDDVFFRAVSLVRQ